MAERDELIQDKERRVYDLKKKNQELEKFKFVLDFRIKELKEQVEPRENNIQEMTGQIRVTLFFNPLNFLLHPPSPLFFTPERC
ncbi:hypothetical protein BC829DRAFT_249868 [Chytridium lagenaria]|nr:hypothetical protein BC829DRAFT_249868 [Chytridium lagenaria]